MARFWAGLAVIFLAHSAAQAAQIFPDALDTLPPADVVILGEVHDNPIHHSHQARAVAALRPTALVFEMLSPEQAGLAMGLPRGDGKALGQALQWEESGWPDFAMYHPIFTAAPHAALYGAALPREDVRRAFSEGAASVFGAEAAQYGLTIALDAEDQSRREAEQMAAHCDALPPEMLPGMVQAQRLRDAALARAVLQALDATGGPVAVITGTGHARTDTGIPAALAQAAPQLRVLSIGQLEAAPGTAIETAPPYDLWIITAPTPRDDPCAVFRKN